MKMTAFLSMELDCRILAELDRLKNNQQEDAVTVLWMLRTLKE